MYEYRYPYPVSGKLTKNFGVGVPPAHQLFQDLRDVRGWRRMGKEILLHTDLVQNPHPLFKKLLTGLVSG